MNNDSGYMKIIYVHCSEETNMKFSYIHNHYSSLGWFIWTQHNDQLPVGLLAQLVERCTGIGPEKILLGLISTTSSVVFIAARISYSFLHHSAHI